ncbi:DUF1292 domain-containing protein [Ammoniphilus sp. YIM 78166]|uniref:DUF1292 domain-containing protein n=1 Tax=Ammoniphilus sp. YIM 78166 TaxID=1644106 RepID=UPI00106FAB38|nr:DUF1292 domain-containing protein [Ammoniphilus sp. YIM 78166]
MEPIEVGEIFTLVDENNEEQEVEVLGMMEIEGSNYIAVSFVQEIEENDEEDIDVFFLRIDADGELGAIESDEEFEKVAQAFESAMDEEHCDDPEHNHG